MPKSLQTLWNRKTRRTVLIKPKETEIIKNDDSDNNTALQAKIDKLEKYYKSITEMPNYQAPADPARVSHAYGINENSPVERLLSMSDLFLRELIGFSKGNFSLDLTKIFSSKSVLSCIEEFAEGGKAGLKAMYEKLSAKENAAIKEVLCRTGYYYFSQSLISLGVNPLTFLVFSMTLMGRAMADNPDAFIWKEGRPAPHQNLCEHLKTTRASEWFYETLKDDKFVKVYVQPPDIHYCDEFHIVRNGSVVIHGYSYLVTDGRKPLEDKDFFFVLKRMYKTIDIKKLQSVLGEVLDSRTPAESLGPMQPLDRSSWCVGGMAGDVHPGTQDISWDIGGDVRGLSASACSELRDKTYDIYQDARSSTWGFDAHAVTAAAIGLGAFMFGYLTKAYGADGIDYCAKKIQRRRGTQHYYHSVLARQRLLPEREHVSSAEQKVQSENDQGDTKSGDTKSIESVSQDSIIRKDHKDNTVTPATRHVDIELTPPVIQDAVLTDGALPSSSEDGARTNFEELRDVIDKPKMDSSLMMLGF